MMMLTSLMFLQTSAQNKKPIIGILNAEVNGIQFNAETVSSLLRMEIAKTDSLEVIDKHDAQRILQSSNLDAAQCFGKMCLLEAGKILNADFMLSAQIAPYGETFMLSLSLYDVAGGRLQKNTSREYLMLPQEIKTIIEMSVRELLGKPLDPKIMSNLTKRFNYENAVNTPKEFRLELDGPRFGGVIHTGEATKILRASKSEGGYDAVPLMFQFGYQFEKQYLNQGDLQALFEVIPTITGLDQGLFFPSIAILHGLRTNKNGWELAFGPSIRFITVARGAYDAEGKWLRESEWNLRQDKPSDGMEWRADSRGLVRLTSSFVFAFGRSYKSGNLNIPVNVFFAPSRQGARFGVSFGFNGRAGKTAQK